MTPVALQPEALAPSGPRGRLLAAVTIAAGLIPLNSTMVAVALPAMSADFGAAAATVTIWVVTGYLITTLVCQTPAGSISDRIGHGRALSAGRWIFAAGAAAAVLAPALGVLVAGRLLMAAGGALLVPTAMALLRSAVPVERRPRAFGLIGAAMAGSAALGPAIGGVMTAQLGWRSLFVINLPLLLASWLLEPSGLGGTRRREKAAPAPFDWAGSLLLAVALVLFVGATRSPLPAAYLLALGAAAGLAGLIAWERRVAAPVLDLGLFRQREFVAGACAIALQNLAMYALLFQIPFLVGLPSSAGESQLGLVMMVMTVTMAVTSPIGGRLAEWAGVRALVLSGGLLGSAAIVSLTRVAPGAWPSELAGHLLFVGLALGLSTGPSNAAALSAAPRERSAMAGAVVAMLRYLGAIVGTAILGFALAGDGAEMAARHQTALWIFVAAFFLSALAGLALPGRLTRGAGGQPSS